VLNLLYGAVCSAAVCGYGRVVPRVCVARVRARVYSQHKQLCLRASPPQAYRQRLVASTMIIRRVVEWRRFAALAIAARPRAVGALREVAALL